MTRHPWPRWIPLLALALGAAAAGCSTRDEGQALGCRDDSQCAGSEVCFPDGCGDPGRDIFVEVTGNPRAGVQALDFPVDALRATYDIALPGATLVQGQVRREGGGALGVTGPVVVSATGESVLIPGLTRRYEATVVPEGGTFRVPMGSGRYTLTLLAEDPGVPPLRQVRTLGAGEAAALDFVLPASERLRRLEGRLVRVDGQELPTEMELQAVELLGDQQQRPLSQRVRVGPLASPTGDFTLLLLPDAPARVTVRATPVGGDALVPETAFPVDLGASPPVALTLDYGEAQTLSGRVLGSDGAPLARATVYIEGEAVNGGTFRTRAVSSDAQGRFALESLPSAPGAPHTLLAVPLAAPGATAPVESGIARVAASVPAGTDALLPDVRCPARVRVEGELVRPDAEGPAAGVAVVATPVAALGELPLPAGETQTRTDAAGRFALLLDPAEYRLDFLPTEALPRVSRRLEVPAGGALAPLTYTLSRGRLVRGTVTLQSEGGAAALPFASVRFFRVTSEGTRRTALLLAESTADANGQYSATLPTP